MTYDTEPRQCEKCKGTDWWMYVISDLMPVEGFPDKTQLCEIVCQQCGHRTAFKVVLQ